METNTRGNGAPFEMPENTATTLSKASSSAHAAVDSVAAAADEAARKAKPAIDRVAAMAHEAVDKASSTAAPAADWLSEQAASLNATQKKLVEGTTTYVAANPFKSLGIALVAGLLLSRIILK